MKKCLFLLVCILFVSVQVFGSEEKISYNESLLPYKGGILISNCGTTDESHAVGYILYYKNGTLKPFIKKGSLNKPSAMAVYKNKLYVCDKNQLKVFNLRKLTANPTIITFPVQDRALNDIAVYKDALYITSTQADRIYKLDLNASFVAPRIWLNIPSPNGIFIADKKAYIATCPKDYTNPTLENVIYCVKDLDNPSYEKLTERASLYDGIAIYNNKLYVSDCLESTVYELRDKRLVPVYTKHGMTPADITVFKGKIYIPDMFNSRVILVDLETLKEDIIQ